MSESSPIQERTPLPELAPEVRVVLVAGNAGVGKTSYGLSLARAQGMALLDIDTVSEALVQAGLRAAGRDPDDRDSPEYKSTYREAIHETLFRIAEQNLPEPGAVIVAPFTRERRDPSFLQQVTKRLGVPLELHLLECSESERKKRIIARGNPRDSAKLLDWERYAQAGVDPSPLPFWHRLIRTD